MLLFIIISLLASCLALPNARQTLFRFCESLTEDSLKKQNEWVCEIQRLQNLACHYFQREIYLNEEVCRYSEQSRRLDKDLTQGTLAELERLKGELVDVRSKYRYYKLKFTEHAKDKPHGKEIKRWETYWDQYDGYYGKLTWAPTTFDKAHVKFCTEFGGCCERPCQCCSKSRARSPDGRDMYSHCTEACGCCVRYRGFYAGLRVKPPPGEKGWK